MSNTAVNQVTIIAITDTNFCVVTVCNVFGTLSMMTMEN